MSSAPRQRPLSKDELQRIAEQHLSYELRGVAYLMALRTPQHIAWYGNAVLEGFLVHARVLDDFLGKAKPFGEDVLATDFAPAWRPRYALDHSTRTDIDRKIAHLTLDRVSGFGWLKVDIARAVMRRFSAFMVQLQRDAPERVAWIEPVVKECRDVIERTARDGWPRR